MADYATPAPVGETVQVAEAEPVIDFYSRRREQESIDSANEARVVASNIAEEPDETGEWDTDFYGASQYQKNAAAFLKQNYDIDSEDAPVSAGTRAFLSFLSSNDEELVAAYRVLYPEGDLKRIPLSEDIVVRKSPSDKWEMLDENAWNLDDLPGDIADWTEILAPILGETAAMGLVGIAGLNPNTLVTMSILAVGAAAGAGIRELAKKAVGTQRRPWSEVQAELAQEAMFAAGGGLIGNYGSRLVGGIAEGYRRGGPGRGVIRLPGGWLPPGKESYDRVEIYRKLQELDPDLADLPIYEITDNVIFKNVGKQAEKISPHILGAEKRAVVEGLTKLLKLDLPKGQVHELIPRMAKLLDDLDASTVSE